MVPRSHHLASLYQPVLIGTVVGDRVVDGADVLPQQHVALLPAERVKVFGLYLVRKEELEGLVALLLRQLVDADRVARIGVEHLAARERVREENRMRDRRLRLSLRVGERRALAAFL